MLTKFVRSVLKLESFNLDSVKNVSSVENLIFKKFWFLDFALLHLYGSQIILMKSNCSVFVVAACVDAACVYSQ